MVDPVRLRQVTIKDYLAQRAGLARRGERDKITQINMKLAELGFTEPQPVGPPQQANEPPRKRRTRKSTNT